MKENLKRKPEPEGFVQYDEALREMQEAMKDEDWTGLETEEDIVRFCKEVRRGLVY